MKRIDSCRTERGREERRGVKKQRGISFVFPSFLLILIFRVWLSWFIFKTFISAFIFSLILYAISNPISLLELKKRKNSY